MRNLPWILAASFWFVLAAPLSVAQSDDETTPAAEEAAEEDEANERDPLIREGVFKPSEELDADSEISFPADI